jgi:hypothetical protein
MSWKNRLRDLLLAGGVLALGGCNLNSMCGNANPDPCICGRPESDPAAKAACSAKRACESDGGVWRYGSTTIHDDGGGGPHCTSKSSDGASSADGADADATD